MRKTLSLLLALCLVIGLVPMAFAEEMTAVNTPRSQTLIVEAQSAASSTAGQFNPWMNGTQNGFGIHQLLWSHLYEIDTVKGEQYPALASGFPEQNEGYTEHTIPIREGIAWSDGEPFGAKDVVYTLQTIMSNPDAPSHSYLNQVFEKVELLEDYKLKITTKEAFPLMAETLGVTIWGNDFRIVPEHIYSKQEDPTKFKDSNPVVIGPYTVNSYDELGNWILYEKRADWDKTEVGILVGEPKPQYIWFRYLGDNTSRTMAMINNEVDILCEVSPEDWDVIHAANPNTSMWYEEYPFALSDDPCSKGIAFNSAKAPFDNKDFRWALTLILDFTQVSLDVFNGVGRASVLQVPATAAMQELYYKPMEEWLENFELEPGYKPFNTNYAQDMAAILREQGIELPEDEAALEDIFGIGWWKQDLEKAEELLIKAGLEKKDDGWYYEGNKFSFMVNVLADAEVQAYRSAETAVDQWKKFGLDVELRKMISAEFSNSESTGEFEVGGYWPSCGIIRNIYKQFSGWDNRLIKPIGELSTGGNGERWDNQVVTDLLIELSSLTSETDRSYEIGQEILQEFVREMPFIGFHSGVKYVPTNATYWTNYPSSENMYNGPWWWWSVFKYMTPHFEPIQK